jgi:glycerol kinase
MVETTAAGAAYLAGLATGFWDSTDALRKNRQLDRSFSPTMAPAEVRALLSKWEQAVSRAKDWETQ